MNRPDSLPKHVEPVRSRRPAAWPVVLCTALLASAVADDKPAGEKRSQGATPPGGDVAPIPLNKNGTVLLDKKRRRLLLKAHVALRQGALEMLCCLKQTKEHESILSLDSKAYVVHAGLLALDAEPGTPVQFNPDYQPPTGQKIDIFVNWTDDQGKSHRVPAQSWVRQSISRFRTVKMESLPKGLSLPKNTELRYDGKLKELSWYGPMTAKQKDEFLALSDDADYRKAIESFFELSQSREMKADFVFAGSGFYTDEETGQKAYLAEGGDLICVANFGDAMIDVAMHSSADDADRNFEAYTERIPPRETPVTIELIPVATKDENSKPKK